MDPLSLFQKPELVWCPGFIWQRLSRFGKVVGKVETVTLPWGLPIQIQPQETVGRHIWAFGVFDVTVCEVLWRLPLPGELTLDVGGNLGQMSSLLAARVGTTGKVIAFEPHPEVNADLRNNVRGWDKWKSKLGSVEVNECALSDRDGEGVLHIPQCFGDNRGLASAVNASEGSTALPIRLRRLDTFLPAGSRVGVMKLDVEGGELAVLQGATELLREKRIRDIVFEDHDLYPSAVAHLLESFGYKLFSIRLRLGGPVVRPASEPTRALRPWDSPSFLATTDPARVTSLFEPGGWQCL